MSKILAGFLGVVMVVAVVGGTAYALFSDTATVSGLSVATGNADLLVNDEDNVNLGNVGFGESFYPGLQKSTTFDLKNDSTSNISLSLKGQLTSYAGNWTELAHAVEVNIERSGSYTGWITLYNWNAGQVDLPGGPLADDATATYTLYVRVPLTYSSGPLTSSAVGNEVATKSLWNGVFTITATQVP